MPAATDPLTFITSALAPVVALSVCAILASNAQSQYSLLIDRLRALNDERRGYQDGQPLPVVQAERLKSLEHQIPVFYRRALLLRNAMSLLFGGMMAILLTSFLIVSRATFRWELLSLAAKWSFFAGLVCVFLAVTTMLVEVFLTSRVVRYELGLFDERARREAEREFRGY